jgi:hypothetical protein
MSVHFFFGSPDVLLGKVKVNGMSFAYRVVHRGGFVVG